MIQSPSLTVNEHGIDIIKDFQMTVHLDYSEITRVEIKRGFLLEHWLSTLVLGLLITAVATIAIIDSIIKFDSGFITSTGVRLYLLLQFVPWIICILGLLLSFTAVRISPILFIYIEYGKYRVAIKEIEKEKKIGDLIDFLKDRVVLVVGDKIKA
jgi:hypothetical protein